MVAKRDVVVKKAHERGTIIVGTRTSHVLRKGYLQDVGRPAVTAEETESHPGQSFKVLHASILYGNGES